MQNLFCVQDKVICVSGGSLGIGRAIAESFQDAGARVIVSAKNEAALRATGLDYQVCDVTDSAQIGRCVDHIIDRFGQLDVLFNVAGLNFRHAAVSFPEQRLDEILAVNVRGSFLMAKCCGAAMVRRRRGKIVNIASLHTQQSLAGVSAYGMSKGAIGSMTRALAVEWAASNVQVNAIAPGFIRTDMNAALWKDEAIRGWVERRTPAGRLGEPRDLLGTALFLASAASDFMTGQILYVDGGFTAGSTWPLEISE
ncbi:MAG: SDR family oxidoreductase [Bryobacteraceae bacterium]|jgi:NAD(P)-dependent dehydrogenase (short-subunit alcohol dehydrogenase family)